MDAVKAFNAELSALYEVKPPISKAKMNSLTRGAIKAIKFYKHVVQSVEKFIQKCKPEYKVPGLYVIDSIVRQSRHQFGIDKDVFAPRFAKNMQLTFLNLLKCPPEDKSKVIRVLNLWQKNSVFPSEVIQPLFDLVDPNHPIHKEQTNSNGILNASGNSLGNVIKTPPSVKGTPKEQKMFTAKQIDPAWLAQTMECTNMVQSNVNQVDASFLDQLQHLQQILLKNKEATNDAQSSVKFDKKLLDFDYGEEEEDDSIRATSPTSATPINQYNSATGSLESLGLLLTNPEVLRQLQTLQQTMQGGSVTNQHEMEEKMRKLQQMKQQEEEFDKHLAQTVPNLPFASECELNSSDLLKQSQQNVYSTNINAAVIPPDMSQPPPGYPATLPYGSQPPMIRSMGHDTLQDQKSPLIDEIQDPDYQGNNPNRRDSSSVEIVNCENLRSQSRSPDRFRRHSRSRSPRHRDRDRGRDRDRDRDRKSRSRSRSRRRRSRSRERDRDRKRDDSRDKMTEEERERQRERRKRGLPSIMRDKLSVCSTTLWVGHLSKLVHQEELSDTFGEFGDIVSIDLIPPRGCAFICMNRRQDAYRALTKLKNHKMQGKAITLAWAPGKGVKGKEWKDYWEVESGVSYIPWSKLNDITDSELELLEEGGMIDDETLPPKLKGRLKHSSNSQQQHMHSLQSAAGMQGIPDGLVNVMPPVSGAPPPLVDTSQPPPIRAPTSATLLPTNPQLQMIPPGFTMSGVPRMLGPMGLSMAHGLMPNVPIGVPPPNMQGLLGPPGMMQPMLTSSVNSPFGTGVGVGALLTQIPLPTPSAPSDKSNSTGMPHNVTPIGVPPPVSESNLPPSLSMMRQPYNVAPPMQMSVQSQQSSHGDDMDVEMEDAMPQSNNSLLMGKDKPNLSDQLLAVLKSDNDGKDYRDRDRERERERERDRDARDRRDRNDRDDRGRDRGRSGRDRGGRDRRRDRDDRRDRDRDSRDSSSIRHQDSGNPSLSQDLSDSKKDSKLSLTDRLRQLADGTLPLDDRIDRGGRGSRNDRSSERHDRNFDDGPPIRRLNDAPPALMDLPKFAGVPDRQRGPDFRGNSQDHQRDFAQRDRERASFGHRGGVGGGPRGPLPLEDFNDPRMHGGRFQDDRMDGRHGPKGSRADDFDPRLSHAPRDEFDRPDLRVRHPSQEDYDRERFEFEMRQRDGFDPRTHVDHPDFEPRRREFFRGPIEPGFGVPMPIIGPRGPRGPLGPDAFGPQRPPGPRGHGPPMFHPRGMGPRGMRPGMRPLFGPRGMGPQFDPRENEAFFRAPFDEGGRGPPPHLRMPFGPNHPRMGTPSLMPGSREEAAWNVQQRNKQPENGPPGVWETPPVEPEKKSSPADRNRSRKSRWGNASPHADKENWDTEIKEAEENTVASVLVKEKEPEFQENVDIEKTMPKVMDNWTADNNENIERSVPLWEASTEIPNNEIDKEVAQPTYAQEECAQSTYAQEECAAPTYVPEECAQPIYVQEECNQENLLADEQVEPLRECGTVITQESTSEEISQIEGCEATDTVADEQ